MMEEQRRKAATAEDRNKFTKEAGSPMHMDRISMLPDELLGFILSLLTLTEASATSILSRRWKCLWTFTPSLDFDGVDSLLKLPDRAKGCLDSYSKTLDELRSKFVRWVNNALALRNDYPTIKGFKIHFNLEKNHQNFIDEWIEYALEREVQTLKLNLTQKSNCGVRSDDDCYVFPSGFMHNNFKQLKSLSLHFVKVDSEALNFFLHNCPLLECLSVSHLRALSSEMRIIGPFPSLKRLKIRWCNNLEVVEIRDVNLVYFKYGGEGIEFVHHNVPMLVHISVEASSSMEDALRKFLGILPQLEIFDICIQHPRFDHETIVVSDIVKLSNLKKLKVTCSLLKVESLLPLTNLIRAAPCLEKFVFKSRLYGDFCEGEIEKSGNLLYSHLNLKEVEFVGYRGTTNEVQLIMHILENTVALQRIIIDSRKCFESPCSQKLYDASKSIEEDVNARVRVTNQLAKIVPPQIKLQIL